MDKTSFIKYREKLIQDSADPNGSLNEERFLDGIIRSFIVQTD